MYKCKRQPCGCWAPSTPSDSSSVTLSGKLCAQQKTELYAWHNRTDPSFSLESAISSGRLTDTLRTCHLSTIRPLLSAKVKAVGCS